MYVWAIVTSAFYHVISTYMVSIHVLSADNTPNLRGSDNHPTVRLVYGVIFDGDHDFKGPRAPKITLIPYWPNLSSHLGNPRKVNQIYRCMADAWY